MIKRNIAVLLVAGMILGGGALALAQGQPERPTMEAGSTPTPGDRQAQRQAAKECLEGAGENQAERKQCRQQLKRDKARFARGQGGGGPLGRAVHGDLVVPGEGGAFEKVAFDRGKVSQSSGEGRVVIDRPDGPQVSLELTAETRYRGIEDAKQLRKGEKAMVTSRDGKALTVVQRDPNKSGPGTGNKDGRPGVPND